jgi:ABC-2 type transport system ATP-binding protein
MSALLEVSNLSKHYNQVKAVDGISFAIPAGICFGLLGPNGAGKTTTIEMIEGITEPSGGEIFYRGKKRDRQFAQEAGIQFQQTALMDFLTVRETLELFHSFYRKSVSVEHLIDLCHLRDFLDNYSTKLSGGQQQRLLLALALVNDPDIIFLDEPTTGLDPQARHNFWNIIDDIKQRGKTIILTTHYMDEAETLCDELLIIDHGKIIAEGSPATLLREHFDGACITLKQEANLGLVKELGLDYRCMDDRLEIFCDNVESVITRLINKGLSLDSLHVRQPSLEDLFLKLTGHTLRS